VTLNPDHAPLDVQDAPLPDMTHAPAPEPARPAATHLRVLHLEDNLLDHELVRAALEDQLTPTRNPAGGGRGRLPRRAASPTAHREAETAKAHRG